MPDELEVRGLLALMLVTDARRATRVSETGGLLLLEEQDRSRWDREAIAEAHELIVPWTQSSSCSLSIGLREA